MTGSFCFKKKSLHAGLLACATLLLIAPLHVYGDESGYLGLVMGQLPDGVEGPKGALVQDVFLDSPADRDGLRSGDVIVALNDREITDSQGLVESVKSLKPEDKARLKVLRGGENAPKELVLTVAKRPDKPLTELPLKKRPSLGIAFSIQANGQLEVAQLTPDSAAEQAGLKPGDVIIAISGHEAKDYVTVLSLIAGHKAGDEIKIRVTRDGQSQELTAKLR